MGLYSSWATAPTTKATAKCHRIWQCNHHRGVFRVGPDPPLPLDPPNPYQLTTIGSQFAHQWQLETVFSLWSRVKKKIHLMCLFPKCSHFNGEFKYLLYPMDCGIPLAWGDATILISGHYGDPLTWGHGAILISPQFGDPFTWDDGAMLMSPHLGAPLA